MPTASTTKCVNLEWLSYGRVSEIRAHFPLCIVNYPAVKPILCCNADLNFMDAVLVRGSDHDIGLELPLKVCISNGGRLNLVAISAILKATCFSSLLFFTKIDKRSF